MTTTRTLVRTGLLDLALVAVACLVPALTHLLAFPLSRLNPMMLIFVAGVLLVPNRANAYLLAAVLPILTSLVSGMPSPLGALCISLEYATLISLFFLLAPRCSGRLSFFGTAILALFAAKGVYYLAKYLILNPDTLFSTPLLWQGISTLLAAALLTLFYRK